MKEITTEITILKRCPFCGSPAEFTSKSKEFVRCSKGLQCPTEALPFSVEDWNSRPPEGSHATQICKLYDTLFIAQKQVEEWFNKAPEGDRKEEYSRLLMSIVKTLTKARKSGYIGEICGNCYEKKCAECNLNNIFYLKM